MILRRWAAVAVGLLILSGSAQAQDQGNAQKGSEQQNKAQPEQTITVPAKPSIGRPTTQSQAPNQTLTEPEVYQPNCGKPKNQPDADLCTQWRVADAAEKALQYTLAQTIIGALGVAFVVVTLGFTARANKAAAIAAQAAVDAVGAERAWMSVPRYNIDVRTDVSIDNVFHPIAYIVYVSWINAGRSPAINLSLYIDVKEVLT